jgi:hypothetical protein
MKNKMRKLKETRIAKFQSTYYSGKWGFKSSYPELKLAGKWLKDAGFEINETCQINVSKNKISITKIKPIKNDTSKKASSNKGIEAKSMERP